MRRSIGRAAALALLALALSPAAAGAVLYIDINSPGGKQLPLAVGDFVVVSGSPALSRGIPKMLEADLELLGAGGELTGYAAGVLVHDLLQPVHEMLGPEVLGVQVGVGGSARVLAEGGERLQDLAGELRDPSV